MYIFQHEELVILYVRCLVSIDGFSLLLALKACRNQVARGKHQYKSASEDSLSSGVCDLHRLGSGYAHAKYY